MTPASPPQGPLPDWDELAHRLDQRPQRRVSLPNFRESAVLVLLIEPQRDAQPEPQRDAQPEPQRDAQPESQRDALPAPRVGISPDTELLFIVRTASLPTHPGQIAFPGGKRETSDATLTATALREAAEEVGIAADAVRILGTLDDVPTPLGFVITPVVGAVRGPVQLHLDAGEVAHTFTVALQDLPGAYVNGGQADWQGYRYTMHEFHHDEHRIWGATAAITLQLLDLLALLAAPPRDPEAIR